MDIYLFTVLGSQLVGGGRQQGDATYKSVPLSPLEQGWGILKGTGH